MSADLAPLRLLIDRDLLTRARRRGLNVERIAERAAEARVYELERLLGPDGSPQLTFEEALR